MRIAMVISSFAESSLSLAQALAKKHSVDVYICVYHLNQNNLAGVDFVTDTRVFGKIYEVNYDKSPGTKWCKTYKYSHVYVVQFCPTGQNSKGLRRSFAHNLFKYELRSFCHHLSRQKYNVIEIVTQHFAYNTMSRYLKKQKIIRSYHEVLKNHINDNGVLDSCLNSALENNEHIRVFSEKSYHDIIDNVEKMKSNKQISVVPFGLFNNYLEFPDVIIPEISQIKNYVLFLGSILPYKGLSYMCEAVKKLNNKGVEVKTVIAGKGYDSCFTNIKNDNSFVLINRFLTNSEVVNLIKNCRFLVCPYISISQSGIPQTAFVFRKPLIASNIGTFSQMILSGKSGLLVPPKDVDSLANAIEKLYCDSDLYDNCVCYLHKYEFYNMEYCWDNIVRKYEKIVYNLEG